jgi:hypothetical protein
MPELSPEQRRFRQFLRMIGGMLIGVPIAYALVGSGAVIAIAEWRPEEIVSSILAILLIMVALITGSFATSKRGYRALTDDGLGEPVERETLSTLRRQAVVTGLAGVMMLIPPAAAHLGYTGPASAGALVAIAALLLVQFWLNRRLSRESDELSRAVNAEASAWTLGVTMLTLFGWSTCEKLLLVPAIDSWTLLTAGIALSFLVWMAVSIRRGLVGR